MSSVNGYPDDDPHDAADIHVMVPVGASPFVEVMAYIIAFAYLALVLFCT